MNASTDPKPNRADAVVPPCVIEGRVLYGIEELKLRLRWSKHAMRTARKNGLRIRYAGGRGYVLGCDLLDYFDKHAKDTKA